MSWYIKNCILPKKGKEIQGIIENYIRSGGSLNSKSLPKKLANKRTSMKNHDNHHLNTSGMQTPDYETNPNYYRYLEGRNSEMNRNVMPLNKIPNLNPELKNLNLKAVEHIVLQKLIAQNAQNGSKTSYMGLRKNKQRDRLKTAGNVTDLTIRPILRNDSKPLSAQTSFVELDQVHSNEANNMAAQIHGQNQLRFLKMIQELEEEMKNMGKDSDDEQKPNQEYHDAGLKPIGLNNKKIKNEPHTVRPSLDSRFKVRPKLELGLHNKSKNRKNSDNSSTFKGFSPKMNKMNDAATNTFNDSSFMQEMLSFQVVNASPTFEKQSKEGMFDQNSPKRKRIKELMSKEDHDSINKTPHSRVEDDTFKNSHSNDRRFGGGFRFANGVYNINSKKKVPEFNTDNLVKTSHRAKRLTQENDKIANEERISSRADTDLIMESKMNHNISKNSDYNDERVIEDHEDDSVNEKSQNEYPPEVAGYVALEGKSLVALELDKNKHTESNRRVIKPIKNTVFRVSASSEGTQRL